ncbi:MAG: tetratricopeptide repeat protein [Thermodesulfobacteriota bacterium]
MKGRVDRSRCSLLAAGLLLAAFLSGCALGGVGAHVQGSYYLEEKDYQAGVRTFQAKVKENPNDPLANYYLGRYLLALDRPKEALGYFKRAVELDPDEAEFHFWLGVAYWSVRDFANERQSYQKAIALNRVHVPAHVYLGHNHLDRGQYQEALAEYDTVLKIEPYQPEAMYNRAVALGKLNRKKEEAAAFKEYLEYYPDGSLAREAARSLNERGDFSYRNHLIGVRTVTLEWIKFEPGTADLSAETLPSLNVIGELMSARKDFRLEIRSYYKGDQKLAQARGQAIKAFIVDQYPEVSADRVSVKAHGSAESIKAGRKVYSLSPSVSFWTYKS